MLILELMMNVMCVGILLSECCSVARHTCMRLCLCCASAYVRVNVRECECECVNDHNAMRPQYANGN